MRSVDDLFVKFTYLYFISAAYFLFHQVFFISL